MDKQIFLTGQHIPPQHKHAALKAVLHILNLWQCSIDEKQALLGIESRDTIFQCQQDPTAIDISGDCLERLSYLLNIHAALRTQLSDTHSIYTWVRKPNHHPFYDGNSAMDVMVQGRIADLYAVMRTLS